MVSFVHRVIVPGSHAQWHPHNAEVTGTSRNLISASPRRLMCTGQRSVFDLVVWDRPAIVERISTWRYRKCIRQFPTPSANALTTRSSCSSSDITISCTQKSGVFDAIQLCLIQTSTADNIILLPLCSRPDFHARRTCHRPFSLR